MSYEQTIYNQLRKHGITEAGALGVVGNFWCESNCEPYRLQGDFSPYRTASHIYVQNVTNGSISREQFSKDANGFGIYQLTFWTRKQGYYDYWKQSGKNLDNAELQVDYAVKEMQSDFPQLLAFLKATTDVFTATSRVCREFERPAVNNIDARFSAAKRIQNEIDLNAWDKDEPTPTPTPAPAPTPVKDHTLTLRTIDWHCESFKEFALLKALLENRNYDTADWDNDGVWDAFEQFQKDNGLKPDRVCGNLGWTALLKR